MSSSFLRSAVLSAFCLGTAFAQFSGQYALILQDPPVAGRFTNREALRSVAAESYRQQIVRAQDNLRQTAATRGFQVTGNVDVVLNAVFVMATPDRVAELQSLPGVLGVVPMRMVRMTLNAATTLQNAPAAWAALGGQGNAGAGIKVGVIDTGIDQTHPALQDSSLSMPAGFPKCTDGHPEDCTNFTNTKVIVARSYIRLIAPGSDPANPAADSRPDDFSPRDHEGHGTAIASVIAGNPATGAVTISGMAPKAWLGNYRVYGSSGVNDYPPESVVIQALNDAVKDGMDVINFSSGATALTGALDTGAACGLASGVSCDAMATAFENAAKSAVIVVAAGNSGYDGNTYPTLGTISSPASAPSVIAVGAIYNSHYFNPGVSVAGAPSALQNMAGELGDDPYSPIGAYSAPALDVTALGDNGLACSALPDGSLNGVFAIIQRGTCAFVDKVDNAYDAGALGVIMYMADGSQPIGPGSLDYNGIPVIMISQSDGNALKAYVKSNPAAVVTIDPATTEVNDQADANLLAFYSSLGPNAGDYALKPDLVAAGTSIYMAAQNYDPVGGQFSTSRYASADGTSFASPMVAGAAALVKQKHPSWTPAQIRSALINTASQDVTLDDSGDTVDAQWIGAGKLDAGAAVNANVVASPTAASFGLLAAAPANLTRQFTISNLGTSAVTLAVAVTAGKASSFGNLSPGVTPTVDKSSLPVAAGGTATLTVTLTGALPKSGYYTGAVTLKAAGVSLTIPYMYLVGGSATSSYNVMAVDACSDGSGCFEGIVGQPITEPLNPRHPHSVSLKLTDGAGLPVSGATVSWSVTPRNGVTFSSTTTTTDAYGIGTTDITIQRTGNLTVTASVGGQTMTFNGWGWSQPTITTGGVVDAASNKSPIAPGSYVSIYGANLIDHTNYVTYAPNALPVGMDGVSVSFDVPSAKLSVPARIIFISPGQINVQAPWELQGQTSAQVKVTIDNFVFGNVVTVPLADAAPAFFEAGGIASALDGNFALVSAANPVKRGQVVQLYMNGLGPVTGGPASGEYASKTVLTPTKNTATVNIGGTPAQVLFSGLAPGFPGLYQVNAVVPAGIAAGTVPITVSIGGATTKASTLPVN